MDKLVITTSTIYGILLIVGGIIGFLKANSMRSLITGIISALLIFIACKFGNSNPKAGYLYIAAISILLAMFFLIKFSTKHLFMPSGLMLILSTITFVVAARSYLLKNKSND